MPSLTTIENAVKARIRRAAEALCELYGYPVPESFHRLIGTPPVRRVAYLEGIAQVLEAVAEGEGLDLVEEEAEDPEPVGESVIIATPTIFELPIEGKQAAALVEAGYDRLALLADASDEELLAIDGIGPKTLEAIREALADEEG